MSAPLPGQLGIAAAGTPDVPPRPTVATFLRDKVFAWPEEPAADGKRQDVAVRVEKMTLARVLTASHSNDAHFVCYASDLPMRLRTQLFDPRWRAAALQRRVMTADERAIALASEYHVEMVAAAFDVDDEEAHARDVPARVEWRKQEQPKIEALRQAHPGGFIYSTRGGLRIIYSIPHFRIGSLEDAAKWSRYYKTIAASLHRRFGIRADPACADWTRCFRAPRVVRDGKEEARATIGDAHTVATLDYTPTEEDTAELVRLAEIDGKWRTADMKPERGPIGEGQPMPTEGTAWDLNSEPVQRAIAIAAENFPPKGKRHDTGMAFAGMLRRARATEDDACEIVRAIAEAGGSNNPEHHVGSVRRTFGLDEGGAATGFTSLCGLVGEGVAREISAAFAEASTNAFLEPFRERAAESPPPLPASFDERDDEELSLAEAREKIRRALDAVC